MRPILQERGALLAWIQVDPVLQKVYEIVCQADDGDAAHDTAHLLRVALWTMKIGGESISPFEATAAALLHDFVNVPKNHPDRAKASEFSAEKAGILLQELGVDKGAVERIQEAIRDHSFSRGAKPVSPLAQALQDADRLEALGAIGIMRVFSTGVKMGASYFHSEDPWAKTRDLSDKDFSVDHFFTKLLRLPATMNTPLGREEAMRRADYLKEFLRQVGHEIADPAPKEIP